jgi:hypothetical protein
MDYPQFVERLANTAIYDQADPDFLVMAAQALEAAELRVLRDLDPVIFRVRRDVVAPPDSSEVPLDSDVVSVRSLWFDVGGGTFRRLDRRDPEFLDLYGGPAGVPRYWGTLDGASVRLGPAWSAGGTLRAWVTVRPALMAASNPVTWLGTWVPDLLFAAAMIFATQFQRSFGEAQAPGPGSWDGAYTTALAGAVVEERRRKADGPWDNSRTPPVSSVAPPG